jgi:DNA processing protein
MAGGRPGWWTPERSVREVMLALAATPGPLPAVTAGRLAVGCDPVELLRPSSPEPGSVAARLDALGLRFLLPTDSGWPLAAAPPDPPCAWLFVAGPLPPPPDAAVAVVGGRRASPLRLAAARSLGTGLAGVGRCVVSGGAAGVDAAAHAGALDGGGRTMAVLGCGLDVAYPRANIELFRRILAEGGTLLGEHPPGARPQPANFIPRNRLIAALAAAVVVVEARARSGGLATPVRPGPGVPVGCWPSLAPLGTRARKAATTSSGRAPRWCAASTTCSTSSASAPQAPPGSWPAGRGRRVPAGPRVPCLACWSMAA